MKGKVALAIACLESPVSAWQMLSANDATSMPRKHTAHPLCRHDVALHMTTRDDKIGDVGNDIEYFKDDDSVNTDIRYALDGESVSTSGSSNNRIGGRRISLADAQTSSIDNAKTAFSITAATLLAVLFIDDITIRFETVQEWRYTWPSLGIVYVISGLSSILDSGKKQQRSENRGVLEYDTDSGILHTLGGNIRSISSYVPIPNDPVLGGLAALAGLGVLIGGYIDAFFPVWYTSPDLLGTRAGIEADAAAILLVLTMYGVFSNIGRYTISSRKVDYAIMKDNENDTLSSVQFPSWAVAVVLCSQLWEIASATFYSWGEMLGIVT